MVDEPVELFRLVSRPLVFHHLCPHPAGYLAGAVLGVAVDDDHPLGEQPHVLQAPAYVYLLIVSEDNSSYI